MLDAYIIDAIRNEELERDREFERRRIWLELPLPPRDDPRSRRDAPEEHDERGMYDPVVIPMIPEIPIREDDAA